MIYGSFLCVGRDVAPFVELLTAEQMKSFNERLSLSCIDLSGGKALRDVYRLTFNATVDYAIPAWSKDAMELIATQYTGPYSNEMRQLAARMALRRPSHDDNNKGGNSMPVQPPPNAPQSGGALFHEFSTMKG